MLILDVPFDNMTWLILMVATVIVSTLVVILRPVIFLEQKEWKLK